MPFLTRTEAQAFADTLRNLTPMNGTLPLDMVPVSFIGTNHQSDGTINEERIVYPFACLIVEIPGSTTMMPEDIASIIEHEIESVISYHRRFRMFKTEAHGDFETGGFWVRFVARFLCDPDMKPMYRELDGATIKLFS